MKNSISVIICTYTQERWDEILKAVDSIRRQTIPGIELVLVVDHNPSLRERLRLEIPDARVVENQEARGLSGARNSGIAASSGEIIAFLDDDAEAAPDWLARLCAHLDDEGNILGVGGAVEPLWETERPAWYPDEFLWVLGCTYRGLPEKTSVVRNPMGGCMIWRRSVFSGVGGFFAGLGHAAGLPAGCEETELCIRARQRWPQAAFIYEPAAKIYHHVPARRATFSYFRARCYHEGLSKAVVVKLVGSNSGLSSERSYTFRTLPLGVLRGLGDALRGRRGGLGRACAIVAGLAITTLGYLVGSVRRRSVTSDQHPQPAAIAGQGKP